MSRTYRFKNGKDSYLIEDQDLFRDSDYFEFEDEFYRWKEWRESKIDPRSKEGKKLLAEFHSDKKDHVMIWNGPSWFNRLYSQKPHRTEAKRELHKFKVDPEHEVIISKPSRPYWW